MRHDPNMIELVRQLKSSGARINDVLRITGLTKGQLNGICMRKNIRRGQPLGVVEPRPTGGRVDLPVGQRLLSMLQAEADRRQQPLTPFVLQLLRRTADDNLFAAILDDGK